MRTSFFMGITPSEHVIVDFLEPRQDVAVLAGAGGNHAQGISSRVVVRPAVVVEELDNHARERGGAAVDGYWRADEGKVGQQGTVRGGVAVVVHRALDCGFDIG